MNRTRAFRRHQKRRAEHHAYHIIHEAWGEKEGKFYSIKFHDDPWEMAKYMANKMKLCSCEMCRNPRHSHWNNKWTKHTIQERRHLQEDPLNEVLED